MAFCSCCDSVAANLPSKAALLFMPTSSVQWHPLSLPCATPLPAWSTSLLQALLPVINRLAADWPPGWQRPLGCSRGSWRSRWCRVPCHWCRCTIPLLPVPRRCCCSWLPIRRPVPLLLRVGWHVGLLRLLPPALRLLLWRLLGVVRVPCWLLRIVPWWLRICLHGCLLLRVHGHGRVISWLCVGVHGQHACPAGPGQLRRLGRGPPPA
mmetsp:Transcript_35275/g.89264  ORF Transcript_35275/g.89264 Transcript_35275/m.89264 type:complete len:209 (+) Transcript_35275:309-935(+)